MRDRDDMLGVPLDYYRRPIREPADEERPPLSRRTRFLVRATGGVSAFALVALFVVFGLPVRANWNEFALPGDGGLPWRIHRNGLPYDNSTTCAHRSWCGTTPNYITIDEIARRDHLPLVPVATMPTLFGPGHTVFAPTYPLQKTGGRGCEMVLVYVQDGERYLRYAPGGMWTICDATQVRKT